MIPRLKPWLGKEEFAALFDLSSFGYVVSSGLFFAVFAVAHAAVAFTTDWETDARRRDFHARPRVIKALR